MPVDGAKLFRGLRPPEAQVGRLIPKLQGHFEQEPKIPLMIPFILGSSVENAARNHQKDYGKFKGKFETAGVSTSTDRAVATWYATEKGQRRGHVAVIRRGLLPWRGVLEYDVIAHCPEVLKPQDKEIILYTSDGGPMPDGIIESILEVDPSEARVPQLE